MYCSSCLEGLEVDQRRQFVAHVFARTIVAMQLPGPLRGGHTFLCINSAQQWGLEAVSYLYIIHCRGSLERWSMSCMAD